MRSFACAICLAVLSAPAAAQDPAGVSFEVVQAGIYTPYVVRSKRDSSGVIQNVILPPKLALATTTIPARLGVSFGFRFKIRSKANGTINVRKETLYPAPGARSPGSKSPLTVNSV